MAETRSKRRAKCKPKKYGTYCNSLEISMIERDRITPRHRYAYVFVVFLGDIHLQGTSVAKYIPGANLAAYSLRLTQPQADLICLVTHDVSPDDRASLSVLFDFVVEIPYLEFVSKPLLRPREQQLYTSWIDKSCTRWRCLELDMYEKVCAFDADIIIYQNLDHVFELPTPAAVYKNVQKKHLPYGSTVPSTYSNVHRDDHRTPSAACTVLTPDIHIFRKYIKMMEQNQPYGFPPYLIGMDQVSLTQLYFEEGREWTQLGLQYFVLYYYIEAAIVNGRLSVMIHHFMASDKPWWSKRDSWPDIEIWWQVARSVLSTARFTQAEKDLVLRGVNRAVLSGGGSTGCCFCKLTVYRIRELAEQGRHLLLHVPDTEGHVMMQGEQFTCPLITRGVRENKDPLV